MARQSRTSQRHSCNFTGRLERPSPSASSTYSDRVKTLGALASVTSADLPSFADNWDWGSVPVWGAIVVSSLAAWFAYRNLRTAQRTLARNLELDRSAQARLVYARPVSNRIVWPDDEVPELPSYTACLDIEPAQVVQIRANSAQAHTGDPFGIMCVGLHNGSNAPVFNPRVIISWPGSEPDSFGVNHELALLTRAVMPGETIEHTILHAIAEPYDSNCYLGARFSDSAGLSWVQDPLRPIRETTVGPPLRSRISGSWQVLLGKKQVG